MDKTDEIIINDILNSYNDRLDKILDGITEIPDIEELYAKRGLIDNCEVDKGKITGRYPWKN